MAEIKKVIRDIENRLHDDFGFEITREVDRRMVHPSGLIDGQEIRSVAKERGGLLPDANRGLYGPLAVELGYGSHTLRARILLGHELRWIGDVDFSSDAIVAWYPVLAKQVAAEIRHVERIRRSWDKKQAGAK